MHTEYQEFSQSLTALTDEFLVRAKEVGFEQAAEESWEKAKADLRIFFAEVEEFRKEHNIPEDEL